MINEIITQKKHVFTHFDSYVKVLVHVVNHILLQRIIINQFCPSLIKKK